MSNWFIIFYFSKISYFIVKTCNMFYMYLFQFPHFYLKSVYCKQKWLITFVVDFCKKKSNKSLYHKFYLWNVFETCDRWKECFTRNQSKMLIPVWTRSPICSSDIATDLPFSRVSLADAGKQLFKQAWHHCRPWSSK